MLIVRGRAAQGRAMESELDPDPEGDLGMSLQIKGSDRAPASWKGPRLGGLWHGEILPPKAVALTVALTASYWGGVLLLGLCGGTFRASSLWLVGMKGHEVTPSGHRSW